MSNETEKQNVAEKIAGAFKKGVARVDAAIKEHTDEEQEKKVADAVLDVFEEVSDFMPGLLDKVIDFATSRVRKRYDIPDNDK